MSLQISSLNSGSNGNCYYIGNDREAILIDAGISCKETEKRMLRSGLSIEKIKAIFISHEHADHISGLAVLSKKYQIPVYITPATLRAARTKIEKHLIHTFQSDETVAIGQLHIIPFQKEHDADDPHSFIICQGKSKVGVFTDIGIACEKVIHYFKQCDAAFLESNYDEDMLMNGSYPFILKKRITNGKGHLSNKQALELYKMHRPAHMSHLILSHLSSNNNRPDIVQSLFSRHAEGRTVVVASRYEETPVYSIYGESAHLTIKQQYRKPSQLSLF